MVLEIVECVFKLSMKIYAAVDEVQANKKRCQRLADRIRFLVSPLNQLVTQGANRVVYKESLIELVRTLEEARQFLRSFIKGKSVLKKLQDACYARKVKEKFEELNDRLNVLVPALTFGLQVECRKSVRRAFSQSTRLPEDTRDESIDLKEMQKLLQSLGMSSFQAIPSSDLTEVRFLADSDMYTVYCAKYRMTPAIVKKPRFDLKKARWLEEFMRLTLEIRKTCSIQKLKISSLKIQQKTAFQLYLEEIYRASTVGIRSNFLSFFSSKVFLSQEFWIAGRETFLNDAKNMLQFNSENVVRVFGLCVDLDDSYLIVLEYMKRGSLHKVLQTDNSLSEEIIFRMCVETSRGLYFIHCCDVIHGNLTSSKYLVNEDLHVKISGFEFSATESSVKEIKKRSPLCCASPDSATTKEKYSEKMDVYRYGFVLCEILTSSFSNHHGLERDKPICRDVCLETLREACSHNNALDVAIECIELEEFVRPTTEEIVRRLTAVQEMKAS